MAEFAYIGIDTSGRNLKGTIRAVSESEAVIKLETSGVHPVSLKKKAGEKALVDFSRKKNKISIENLGFFSRQFGTLLRAGIPVIEALEALSNDTDLRGFSAVLEQMSRDIQGGSTIAEAMKKQPGVFSEMYVRMVRAGEVGGVVPETLEQLAQMLEDQKETAQAVKSAIQYPVIVLVTLVIAFFIVVGFVLPKLAGLFSKFSAELPLPTKIMIQVHNLFRANWYYMVIGVILASTGMIFALKTTAIRYRWDKYKLRMPVFGSIFVKIYMERFCQLTRVLINAGVPILSVLESVGSAMGNNFLNEEIEKMRSSVHTGKQMSSFMRNSPAFSSLVAQMTDMGERSGRLPELLEICTRHYQKEIKYRLKSLVTIIEPVMTVTIGLAILFLMLSVFLPIWNTVKFFK